jgi:hypothetical protein
MILPKLWVSLFCGFIILAYELQLNSFQENVVVLKESFPMPYHMCSNSKVIWPLFLNAWNQVANLTPNLSFDHNFYLITSIGKCEPNFDTILGSQFEPSLLPNILQICYKNSKLLKDYNSQGVSHLEFLWIPFLALSHICGSMIEY